MWDRILAKEIKNQFWEMIPASDIGSEGVLVFPVYQGLGTKRKIRPCIDMRNRNRWLRVSEKCRLLGIRTQRELTYRLM